MRNDLVFDVGAHEGQDTARYLAAGYRVVAIEANPALADQVRQRFAGAIADQRLTVVDAGVADSPGTMTFWVSSNDLFSSFDRDRAMAYGQTAHAVAVPVVSFRDLLREHGVPYYLKTDVEGMDKVCLAALDRTDLPKFLSMEIDLTLVSTVQRLAALGFGGFKLIRQSNHQAVTPSRYAHNVLRPAVQPQPDHTSGPFGEDTDGQWLSPTAARALAAGFVSAKRAGRFASVKGYNFGLLWHDLHAKRSAP